MLSNKSIRIASYVVMAYILVAIGWWAVLLHKEHDALFDAYELVNSEQIESKDVKIESMRTMNTEQLATKRKRRSFMIISEAVFIGLGLIVGLWVINNGYKNLVQAERVKQNFLLAISHELKSPIASTKLAFETLLRRKQSDENKNYIIQQGLKETNRLHDLVSNILLATKLETGYQPHMISFDLSAQLHSIVRTQQIRYSDFDILITSTPHPLIAALDRQGFIIIATNLIENAMKYSKEIKKIKIDLLQENNEIHLLVADVGVGIPDEEKDKIFQRFYRLGEEGTRKTKGTGLGLYLVRELTIRNGGRVSVQDNQPNGSIFTLQLPLHQLT